MHITRLEAENIKRLRAVAITPDGRLVRITGANGQGKSSVLDAIYMALKGASAIPSKPVRQGADKARIRLDLGEIVVTRRFTAAGGTSLTVEAADGARYPSPQKMLDDLLGALSFDPLAFTRMDRKSQAEQLRSLVRIDADLDALDAANRADFEARTSINRRAKELRAQAAGVRIPEDAPTEPVDVAELSAAMARAAEHNADLERRRANRAQATTTIASLRDGAQGCRDRAADLRRQADEADAQAAERDARADELQGKLDAAGELAAPIDVDGIRARLDAAATTNRAVQDRQLRADLERQAAAAETNAERLTAAIEERTRQRQEAIANAEMPVPGLGFDEDGSITYQGLPLDQASSAEQLRVSIAIAMAANPKLRVLRIKDGSLLDETSMRLVGEMAESADYQVWIEQVDTSGKVGVVIEDGAVRGDEERAERELEEAVA